MRRKNRVPPKCRPSAVAALALAPILGVCTPATAAAQAVTDSTAIRSRVETYLRVWNARDASGLVKFFSDDADFVMGNQPAARGRPEIRAWWQAYFARQEPERYLRLEIASLRFVAPDVAIMSVGTTTGGRDASGQDLRERKFRGTWIWQRQGGQWLIRAMRGLPLEEDEVVLNASREAAETLRPDIRGFVAAYEDALNTHDPDSVTAFFAEGAELMVRDSPLVSGREAIRAWWRAYFAEPRPYRAVLIIDEIRMISPGVALLNITATGAGPQRIGEPLMAVRYARATWVVAQAGGGWRIVELLVLPSEDDEIVRGGGSGAGAA